MKHMITAFRLAVALLSILVLAGSGLRGEWFTAAAAQRGSASPVQRQTTFGPVVGSDVCGERHVCLEGHAVREAAGG